MISKPSVLILGAGSSFPYGLPLASGLRDAVIRGSKAWGLRMQRVGVEGPDATEFANSLAHSGHTSVDAFLEERPEWTPTGKFGIAACLLRFERSDKLFPPQQPRDHWYEALWAKIETRDWASFKKNKLSVVTFNYDRSLEYYLMRVLNNHFGIRVKALSAYFDRTIVHVHGSLGDLLASKLEPFGAVRNDEFVKRAANSIKIVHESDSGTPELIEARSRLDEARTVLFLGFGFHESNMKKLGVFNREWMTSPFVRTVVATHKGYRCRQWQGICRQYGFLPPAERVGSASMTDFLTEFLRSN